MARKKVVKAAAPAKGKAGAKVAPVVEAKKVIPGASVGIDFGTHGIRLAAYKNGTFDLIVNDNGERSTPLYVSFTELERIIGAPAKEAAVRNASNTINYIRSYLGKSNAELADFLKTNTPYKVVEVDGKSAFEVTFKGEQITVSADELCTVFAQSMKKYADNFWDCPVTNAVLSVPSDFSLAAREALVASVEAAGFKVISVLSDPIAAAISFDLDNSSDIADKFNNTIAGSIDGVAGNKKTILVADIGTIDSSLTLITADDGLFKIVDSSVATVSGITLDEKLYDHFVEDFNKQNGCDLRESSRASMRLMQACEGAKRNLSLAPKATLQLDALYEGIDYFTDISRTRFEILCNSVFDAFTKQVTEFFEKCEGFDAKDLTHIVLSGGTAALPKFVSSIQNYLNKQGASKVPILKHDNTGDTIAFGAAKQAYVMSLTDFEAVDAAKAVVSKGSPNSNTNSVTCISSYTKPTLVLSKNLYVQTFQGTLLPLIGTSTSAPSITGVTLNVPVTVPEGFAIALVIYESTRDSAIAAAQDPELKRVGVFALNQNMITSAGVTEEGEVPVTATVRATITDNFNLTVDIAYTSSHVKVFQFSTLFSVDLLAKDVVAPSQSSHAGPSAEDLNRVNTLNQIMKAQLLVSQYQAWANAPKNKNFISKFPHVTVPMVRMDALITSIATILELPNPYNIKADDAIAAFKKISLPSANQLEQIVVELRDLIIRVLKTKTLTKVEADKYNANIDNTEEEADDDDDDDELDLSFDFEDQEDEDDEDADLSFDLDFLED